MNVVPASPPINSLDAKSLDEWRVLAPLPDEVGYAGMFAGVIDGRLVAGGGSQFPERPLWLNGQKTFSDRIFVLPDFDGRWGESPVKLPRPMAHFAVAATPDAVYIVGGCDDNGSSCEVYAIQAAPNASLVFRRLPDLPEPTAYGASVVTEGRLYFAGGQSVLGARSASAAVFSLALADPTKGWRREPDLPDGGTFIGTMAAEGGEVFFIGGVGFDAAGKSVQSSGLWRLDSKTRCWVTLPQMPEPRVGAVSPCLVIAGGRIFVIGGYAAAFPGEARDHPGFSAQTLYYDITRHTWERGPTLPVTEVPDRDSPGDPGPAPMIGAPCVVWHDQVIIISGEVRASVRTPAVLAWPSLHLDPILVDESAQVKTPR